MKGPVDLLMHGRCSALVRWVVVVEGGGVEKERHLFQNRAEIEINIQITIKVKIFSGFNRSAVLICACMFLIIITQKRD